MVQGWQASSLGSGHLPPVVAQTQPSCTRMFWSASRVGTFRKVIEVAVIVSGSLGCSVVEEQAEGGIYVEHQ